MVSFIILSNDQAEAVIFVEKQCQELSISSFDQIWLTRASLEKGDAQSIGIDAIKKLRIKLSLKPLQSKQKALIIQEGEFLTDAAQNALLKLLEEPPNHTYIYLLSPSIHVFLPTILSRCMVINLMKQKIPDSLERGEIQTFFSQIETIPLNKRLILAEKKGKQKDTALSWMEQVVYSLHELLIKEEDRRKQQYYAAVAHLALKTLRDIESTNVTIRLALEHFLLNA